MECNVLCVGDVVGNAGTDYVCRTLPDLKVRLSVDFCLVNGENAAEGNGTTGELAKRLLLAGADVITGGNHTFRKDEYRTALEENRNLLRPANMGNCLPGGGFVTLPVKGTEITVINLIGQVYMNPADCPFDALDYCLERAGKPRLCVVDFHAEATAEKKALAYYADGRISALFGTHTHVQTADEQILPGGTGYLTDVGMSGPTQSVLGVEPAQSVNRMRTKLPQRFRTASGPCAGNAVLFTVDTATGKTAAVKRLVF